MTRTMRRAVVIEGSGGTENARTTLAAYSGETPVLNFSGQSEDPANRGVALVASFWHINGIVVEHAGDNGILVAGSNNIVERTVTRFNRDTGLQLSRWIADAPEDQWPSNNLVLSAESHDNADSDGFAPKLTVGPGNVFRYTVSHNNIDDGYDLYTKSETGPIDPVTIEDSLAYDNGTLSDGSQAGNGDRNGFKLSGDDIAVDHVSIGNTERNFNFDDGTSTFSNNVSCDSGDDDRIIGNDDGSNQFWSEENGNGAACADYAGELGWSFADDGSLVVTFGGDQVTP